MQRRMTSSRGGLGIFTIRHCHAPVRNGSHFLVLHGGDEGELKSIASLSLLPWRRWRSWAAIIPNWKPACFAPI